MKSEKENGEVGYFPCKRNILRVQTFGKDVIFVGNSLQVLCTVYNWALQNGTLLSL